MCDFTKNNPYFFFLPNEECGGHGRCDIPSGICVCEDGWLGRTDLLDFSGGACVIPVVFDKVVWSVAALAWFRLFVQSLFVAEYQVRLFRRRLEDRARVSSSSASAKSRRKYRDTLGVLTFLLPWIFLVLPAIVATMVVRAATDERMGLDAAVSFLYTFGPAFQWFLVAHGQHLLFRNSLIGSWRVRNKELQTISRRHLLGLVSGSVIYFALSGAFTLIPVYLPLDDYRTRSAFIVARNVCLMALVTYHALHSRYITHALQAMLKAMSDAAVNDGGTHERITRALKDMLITTRLQAQLSVVVNVVFLVFSVVPQLWVFNFVAWALIFIVGSGRNHTLHTWAEKGVGGEKSKSSSQEPTQLTSYEGHQSSQRRPAPRGDEKVEARSEHGSGTTRTSVIPATTPKSTSVSLVRGGDAALGMVSEPGSVQEG